MTLSTVGRVCSQAECPFPKSCLEGLSDIGSCPHTEVSTDALPVETFTGPERETDGATQLSGPDAESSGMSSPESDNSDEFHSLGRELEGELVLVTGADSLTLDEAKLIMGRSRCTVVLVAGDAKSGKTTFVVELYARFLEEKFGGWSFAGSSTLRALDVRHFTALVASGSAEPETLRTPDEDIRLLHLCLTQQQSERHLLFSDVRGEFFDDVTAGAGVMENVRIAARADRCVITLDGDLLSNARTTQGVFIRARMLIGGLVADGGLEPDVPIAVVCTKWDKVPIDRRDGVMKRAQDLADFARRDGRTARVQPLSVRPGPPLAPIEGLRDLLDWILEPDGDRSAPLGRSESAVGRRHFWRRPGGAR